MATLAEVPRLSPRALARIREAFNAPEPLAARAAIAEFRARIESHEIRCFWTLTLGTTTMMKAFLEMLRAYLDARLEHAIANYHAQNHADSTRAVVRELADKATAVEQASAALDDFAQRSDSGAPPQALPNTKE